MYLMTDGAAIFLSLLFVLITIGLCFLNFFLIRRNIRKAKEENDLIVENAVSRKNMVEGIEQYIKKVDRFGALALIYVDIDGFADYNEVFGHDACDNLLKEAASRIVRILPYKASLCRYENDEFLIFVKDEDNKDKIERIANQILDVVNEPYQILPGETITMTASIGISPYPVAGENYQDLFSNLQLTTYVSKRDGGNKFTSYYASISQDEYDNMLYYREIKHAIQNKEFVLYYQPIVNLGEKEMFGAEALMRWNHPEKGVQAPSTFLKVLEQSGDIKWVGEWGIETMIKMRNQMALQFPTIPLRFSLNLSTKQLLDGDLASKFIDIMKKNNARPEQYQLEINDFMMVEKIAVIKTNIYKLKDFGFKIAVDGFELDGQSVQNIQRSPIDVIKLGRSFLRDIENNYMKEKQLAILVKYANDNNKQLICEGIESAEVTKYVKEQGIFYGQGYYFAKPMSEEAFSDYIDKHQYQVLLEDVSALEDNERIMNIVGDQSEAHEETPEEYLARITGENKSEDTSNSDNNDDENNK